MPVKTKPFTTLGGVPHVPVLCQDRVKSCGSVSPACATVDPGFGELSKINLLKSKLHMTF